MDRAQAEAVVSAISRADGDSVTKNDLNTAIAALESRLDAKLANAVNRMLLAQVALAGLIVALVKLL